MQIYDGERDLLIRKNVYLVQRGCFKNNVDNMVKTDIKILFDIVDLYYMGSEKFEMGALPKSLIRMTKNKDFYKVFVFDHYKDENGNSLKVYAPDVFFENVQKIIDRLVVSGDGLQAHCSLHRHVQTNDKNEDTVSNYKDNDNFWWDIENDFFIFFEHTKKILEVMEYLRKIRFGYEKNKYKYVLNRIYLEMLTRPNTNGLLSLDTSIKKYHYDEDTMTHFIEFLDNATLENIFMEAIIIAKTGKGRVVFNVNGIPFNIDENSVLDNIIVEDGLDLVDSRTYSDKVHELIAQYNEASERKQKQSELCHVLQLVRDKKAN